VSAPELVASADAALVALNPDRGDDAPQPLDGIRTARA
jgi:hypothetical protein